MIGGRCHHWFVLLDALHYAKSSINRLFSRSFSVPCTQFSLEPPSIENGAHDTKKLLLKTEVKILHSEVNLIIHGNTFFSYLVIFAQSYFV